MANQKKAVVTGASSGIGHATTLELAAAGYIVFAGVRKESDAERLKGEGGGAIIPVALDVTDAASIAAAARVVRDHGGGLDALVNNAGIGLVAPIEHVTQTALRHVFDVDFFGQVAVIQAFMPLLREARGRIVNIGTVGSHLALPFGSALGAAKAAFRSLNDSLRLELRPFGIRVIVVEPGAIRTPAVDKMLGDPDATIDGLGAEGAMRYGTAVRKMMTRGRALEMDGSPPDVVARTVLRALTARRPRVAYRTGKTSGMLTAMRLLPPRVFDALVLGLLSYA